MDEDEEMESLEEWLAILKQSSDEDFTVQARPYFEDTATMRALPRDEAVEHVKQQRYKGRHRA